GVPDGKWTAVEGRNIKARKVLYVGVGPLWEFRYPQIRAFGRRALDASSHLGGRIEVICTPIHGPGYGLDEREAFLSLVGGLLDGIEAKGFPSDLKRIEIVELDRASATRLTRILKDTVALPSDTVRSFALGASSHERLSSFGAESER